MIPEDFGIVPDPSKDQHFLTDPDILKKIVRLSEAKSGDRIFEIGAGIGTLTRHLAKTKAKVIAVEIDKKMRKALGKLKFPNLEVRYENALRCIDGLKFNKIVSNTPYSICEPLMNKLLRRDFDLAVLSIPERFYKRISSGPGGEYYSLLTVKTDAFFKIAVKFRIPRMAFDPEPKTGTVVILLKPLSKRDYAKSQELYILREIFLQGKKKLKNSLLEGIINLNKKIIGKDFTKNMARNVVAGMCMEPALMGKKATEMTIKDFEKLVTKIRRFS